jgi:hypothetical protein
MNLFKCFIYHKEKIVGIKIKRFLYHILVPIFISSRPYRSQSFLIDFF